MLAIVWAVYLIPKALKQHDEVARTRSVDRFSDDTRVVARREPVSRRDARLVVNPPRSAPVTASGSSAVRPAVPRGRGDDRRTAGKVAARRRRRILIGLLLLVVATAVAAYLGYLPRWSPAVPGGLTLMFLLLCRTQVRRHGSRRSRIPAARPRPQVPASDRVERAPQPTVVDRDPSGESSVVPGSLPQPKVLADRYVEPEPVHRYVEPETVQHQAEPAGSAMHAPDTGALWDPVPVTLPTYVTKPKARRTVRTIDLGAAGAWTSGRTPEDAEIAARATDPAASDDSSPKAGQRAVGS